MTRSSRIVSLLPSATEIVCRLGAADDLVGISHECDFPSTICDRAVLTRSRIPSAGPSASIDAAVRAIVRGPTPDSTPPPANGLRGDALQGPLSMYAVDEERLAILAPDVVITQDLCEVCAVSLDDVRRAVARITRRDQVRIVTLRPTRLGDVLDDIERVAEALDRVADGRRVRAELEARIEAVASRAARLPSRPRVASIEWLDPLMLGGTWMPELIELAGGVAVGVAAGRPAPTVGAEDLARLRPDVVLIKPCGFTLERSLGERDRIERAIAAQVGPGVPIYASDGSAFFNRPGPRLVESLEILAACIHPAAFADLAREHADVIRRLDVAS